MKEPEDYKNIIYFYVGMPTKELDILAIEQVSITSKSHPVDVES